MSWWLILIMYDLHIAKQNWIPWPMCEANRNSLLTTTFEYCKSFDQYTLIFGAQQL